jgi:hypothetical protein
MKNKDNNYNSNITKEDAQALRKRTENTRTDGGDDRMLRNREKAVDFTGKDLDVPGRNIPNGKQTTSIKDEENQLYSQGSDENADLERNTNHIEKVS